MTTKIEYMEQWAANTPQERRERLNTLGSNTDKDAELWREHDALATTVAQDEENAARGLV